MYETSNAFFDFFFFLDMIVSFRTAYIDEKGVEEIRAYYIAREYISSTFLIDFFATFPFD